MPNQVRSKAPFGCQAKLPGMPPETRTRRGGKRDVAHEYMTKGVIIDQVSGMPVMHPEQRVPTGMTSFSVAMKQKDPDYSQHVHFYENDDMIERFWNNPWRYLDKLSRFAGVVATDYSTGPGIPDPVRRYNVYRNQLTGAWMQSLGLTVLSNVRCPAFGHDYFLAGVPRGSLICVGEVGCVKNLRDRARFEGGLIRAVQELEPTGFVVVGEDSYNVFDYVKKSGIPLHLFKGETSIYYGGGADV